MLSSELVERNKKYEQQPTKNTPRGKQTSYRLDYSLKTVSSVRFCFGLTNTLNLKEVFQEKSCFIESIQVSPSNIRS